MDLLSSCCRLRREVCGDFLCTRDDLGEVGRFQHCLIRGSDADTAPRLCSRICLSPQVLEGGVHEDPARVLLLKNPNLALWTHEAFIVDNLLLCECFVVIVSLSPRMLFFFFFIFTSVIVVFVLIIVVVAARVVCCCFRFLLTDIRVECVLFDRIEFFYRSK